MFFNDFFNLVVDCKDVDPRYGRTRLRGFFSEQRLLFFSKNSSVADHLLLCNHSVSYDDFRILTRENKTFLLELKESLFIMRDKPSLNRSITSAPLYLIERF